MPMRDGVDYEHTAQLEAWRDEAIRDGVAKVAIRAYISCWRRQVFPRAEFSPEPFAVLVAVVHMAYPERPRRDNSAVALEILDWTHRRHGRWFGEALHKPHPSG